MVILKRFTLEKLGTIDFIDHSGGLNLRIHPSGNSKY